MNRLLATTILAFLLALGGAAGKATAKTSDYYQAKAACYAVFGKYGSQCISVVACETGRRYNTNAKNGQYLGLFQMGTWARSRFGHSYTAWGQARAAWRYFVNNGYSWRGAWSCQPY